MMPTPSNQDMILGELRGQQREMIHSINNMRTELQQLTREVSALGGIAKDVASLELRVGALEADTSLSERITMLEAQNLRVEGARSFGVTILRSPALGWFVGAVVAIWAAVTGKVG